MSRRSSPPLFVHLHHLNCVLLDPGSGCTSPHSIEGIAFGVSTWSTSRISTVQVRQTVLDCYIAKARWLYNEDGDWISDWSKRISRTNMKQRWNGSLNGRPLQLNEMKEGSDIDIHGGWKSETGTSSTMVQSTIKVWPEDKSSGAATVNGLGMDT